jgi:hypothetical protein
MSLVHPVVMMADNPIGSDHTFQATILARNEVCIDGIKLLQDADSGSRPTQ